MDIIHTIHVLDRCCFLSKAVKNHNTRSLVDVYFVFRIRTNLVIMTNLVKYFVFLLLILGVSLACLSLYIAFFIIIGVKMWPFKMDSLKIFITVVWHGHFVCIAESIWDFKLSEKYCSSWWWHNLKMLSHHWPSMGDSPPKGSVLDDISFHKIHQIKGTSVVSSS